MKPDFSNGLHTNGFLDAEKVYWYDKLKNEEKQKEKEQKSKQDSTKN